MGRPEGVRIVREDGSSFEPELVHLGTKDGEDHWAIANASIRANRDKITVEVLPPHTALTAQGTLGPPDRSFPHMTIDGEPPPTLEEP